MSRYLEEDNSTNQELNEQDLKEYKKQEFLKRMKEARERKKSNTNPNTTNAVASPANAGSANAVALSKNIYESLVKINNDIQQILNEQNKPIKVQKTKKTKSVLDKLLDKKNKIEEQLKMLQS